MPKILQKPKTATLTITALIILITLLLLSHPALSISQEIKDPSNIEELTVKITQHGKILIPDGKLEWVKINLTFPKDNTNQELTTTEKYTQDNLGNNILTIKKDNPRNIITYSAESIVTIKERRTLHIPETYTIPDNIKIYLKPAKNIQSTAPEIKALAKELTKDSKTDFERIAKLATWVHENIEYKLSLGTESKDALWTLKNKVGTCDEFSSLFIALARASGYPARYISGHAYGKDGWEKHAFADVYIGRWIPVDPTWNEVGNLDATHIQLATKEDNIVKNEIQAYGTKIGEMTWAEDETEIEILAISEKQKQKDYKLLRSSDKLEMGEEAIILLKFTPKEYKVVKLDLEPCISRTPIAEIDEKEKSIILEPGKQKTAYWKIKISENLKKNTQYTCPLTLNSRLLTTRSINLTINTLTTRKADKITLDTTIDKTDLILGEKQAIKITIEKTQGTDPVTIGIIQGIEHIEKTYTLKPGETEKLTHIHTRSARQTRDNNILINRPGKNTKIQRRRNKRHLHRQNRNTPIRKNKRGNTSNNPHQKQPHNITDNQIHSNLRRQRRHHLNKNRKRKNNKNNNIILHNRRQKNIIPPHRPKHRLKNNKKHPHLRKATNRNNRNIQLHSKHSNPGHRDKKRHSKRNNNHPQQNHKKNNRTQKKINP